LFNFLIKSFIKDYRNVSDFKVRENYGKFSGIVGIATNIILFIIKITAGTLFHSIAITADAINNLSDSGSSIVTLVGFKLSGKPADKEHPYGHARMEYISGLIVSFVILMLGFQLIMTSFSKIFHPEPAEFSIISVVILVVSIFIKLWQCMFYRKVGSIIDSTTLLATSMDSRNDIFATSAVLLGTVITKFTSFNPDGYMGVIVAIFILITGFKVIMETISPLLGKAPTKEMVEDIYKKILSYDGIIGLHDLEVHSYGAGQYFASVHCEVSAEQDIMISHDLIDNIERDFTKEEKINLVIHLDPIVTNDPKTNELRVLIGEIIKSISDVICMHDFRVVWGMSHSNIIFDVVVPYNFSHSDKELVQLISEKIHNINSAYYPVITVDHDYIPTDEK